MASRRAERSGAWGGEGGGGVAGWRREGGGLAAGAWPGLIPAARSAASSFRQAFAVIRYLPER